MAYTYEYARPALTADALVFWFENTQVHVLLIKRKQAPFKGQWALPGGFVDLNEAPEAAFLRELQEEVGLTLSHYWQIGAFGQPDRDPRGHTVSVVYGSVLTGPPPAIQAGDDALEAQWFLLTQLPDMAFDHAHILQQARKQLQVQLKGHLALQQPFMGLQKTQMEIFYMKI